MGYDEKRQREEEKDATVAPAPAPTKIQQVPTGTLNKAPLAHAGDFYRAIPGFSFADSISSSPRPALNSSPSASFPSSFPSDNSKSSSHDNASRPLSLNASPTDLNNSAWKNDLESDTMSFHLFTNNAHRNHENKQRDALKHISRDESIIDYCDCSVRLDSLPPLEFGRAFDVYGIPQQITNKERSLPSSPTTTGVEGRSIYARAPILSDRERSAATDDGTYHGRAEPMFEGDGSSSPMRSMEITTRFPTFEFPVPVPAFPPAARPVSSNVAPRSFQHPNSAQSQSGSKLDVERRSLGAESNQSVLSHAKEEEPATDRTLELETNEKAIGVSQDDCKHVYEVKHTMCGWITTVILFPVGAIALLLDRYYVCKECGHVLPRI